MRDAHPAICAFKIARVGTVTPILRGTDDRVPIRTYLQKLRNAKHLASGNAQPAYRSSATQMKRPKRSHSCSTTHRSAMRVEDAWRMLEALEREEAEGSVTREAWRART